MIKNRIFSEKGDVSVAGIILLSLAILGAVLSLLIRKNTGSKKIIFIKLGIVADIGLIITSFFCFENAPFERWSLIIAACISLWLAVCDYLKMK